MTIDFTPTASAVAYDRDEQSLSLGYFSGGTFTVLVRLPAQVESLQEANQLLRVLGYFRSSDWSHRIFSSYAEILGLDSSAFAGRHAAASSK